MSVLDGRCVLVTGGSRGIGRAVAQACLAAGARVLLCARDAAVVDETVRALACEAGSRVDGVACDVTRQSDLEQALDRLESRFGALTSLVHAAGVLGPIGPLTNLDPDAWWEAVRVNLYGTFLTARQACVRMVQNGGGRVVLLSGGGAATPFPFYTAYASAKAGVVRLAENLALELADADVEVNALAPGMVATRIHDGTLAAGVAAGEAHLEKTRRMLAEGGYPAEQAAAAAVFLLSEAARGITGRLLSAPWDDWPRWPEHAGDLADGDLFTLRRVVPRDRGQGWQ